MLLIGNIERGKKKEKGAIAWEDDGGSVGGGNSGGRAVKPLPQDKTLWSEVGRICARTRGTSGSRRGKSQFDERG